MNKWYHPFGLLLLAAMVGDLSGCAQTSGWLAKTIPHKKSDEKLAKSDKKSRDTNAKKNTSKEMADMKSDKSKSDKSKSVNNSNPKVVDAEHEKYAAADRLKKKKAAADSTSNEEKMVAASVSKLDRPIKSKPKTEPKNSDDDLDMFLTKTDAPGDMKKSTPKKVASEDFASADDQISSSKKNVVQVKKEVAKVDTDDDISDWAIEKPKSEKREVKSASIAESFEEELESPFGVANDKPQTKSRESKRVAAIDSFDEPSESAPAVQTGMTAKKKMAVKHEDRHGFQELCPSAEGDLSDLLASLDPADPESLKKGLHRIGQMGNEGAASAPLLRKMLKHEDAFVRAHAALAMARLNLSSAESIAVVIDSLKSRDASLRSFGVAVLGEMGPQANDVLSALAESLSDRNGQVRLRAAEVLIRNEDWADPALQTLLACLKDKDENVRWLATYSMAELAPESPEAVQALIKAAKDRVPKVQAGAVYALSEIGPFAKRSSDELRRIRDASNDDELKSAIDYALKQMNM